MQRTNKENIYEAVFRYEDDPDLHPLAVFVAGIHAVYVMPYGVTVILPLHELSESGDTYDGRLYPMPCEFAVFD